jgi:hypothetical protein
MARSFCIVNVVASQQKYQKPSLIDQQQKPLEAPCIVRGWVADQKGNLRYIM